MRTTAALTAALPELDRVIVDLTARAYDAIDAVTIAHAAGLPVLAVGQHDAADVRRRALAAGADRVHPYRQLFEDGPRQLERWLARGAAAVASDTTAADGAPHASEDTPTGSRP